jgi:hypothetical protein
MLKQLDRRIVVAASESRARRRLSRSGGWGRMRRAGLLAHMVKVEDIKQRSAHPRRKVLLEMSQEKGFSDIRQPRLADRRRRRMW